jgi:hypothetical protein
MESSIKIAVSFLITMLASSVSYAEMVLPTEIVSTVKSQFSNCDLGYSQKGNLFNSTFEDYAVMLECKEDGDSYHRIKKVVVFKKITDKYIFFAQTGDISSNGIYDFDIEIKKKSLFLHMSFPNMTIAEVYDYQFKSNGKCLILI